ncbi:hypothetical protein [Niastella populi]|uniref:Uncharacterized protein n=1 Tax=Niastella populi TaxID=550983 RepID=A0A1V9FGS1_9BACT|nr:hypothetical protein [Niastella populi]OQP57471.1 hypothetical protein A4R26_24170 [Niastella populi]
MAVVDDADRLSHGMPETGYARTNGEFTKIEEVLTQATDAAKNAELLATLNQWDNAMYRKLDDVLKDVRYPNLVNEFAAGYGKNF